MAESESKLTAQLRDRACAKFDLFLDVMSLHSCLHTKLLSIYRVFFLTGPPPEFAKCWPVSN